MTRILRTLKKISFLKIFLLIRHYHQVRPGFHWYIQPRKTKIIVFAEKNSIVKTKAKVRIFLPPVLTLLPSRKTRTKIKTQKI